VRIFLAGATGVIGRSLIPLLREAGHEVTGTTRTTEGSKRLKALGIDAVVVDVFDRKTLERAIGVVEPDVIVHQLSDLSAGNGFQLQSDTLKRNAQLRREGTANLAGAARSFGVRRLVAQSIAWAYAPKVAPFDETDSLDVEAEGLRAITIREGIVPLEDAVLRQDDFEGVVLRYGQLYGPGTWSDDRNGTAPIHVEAAAYAAFLALDLGHSGAYNVAEPGGTGVVQKAVTELGWNPDFRHRSRR
jgi:nucleoside-diphosphate-sugar epimerase